jgi:ribosomal-protein-alanine N-acetyltransferase
VQLWLEVRESNAPAIALYDSYGFAVVGTRKGYYPADNGNGREDALLMGCFLFN